MRMTAKIPAISAITQAGVLVFVSVSISVCSLVFVLIFELSLTSDCAAVCVSLSDEVCTLFCLVLPVCRCVLVVLTGCCVPVLSGSLQVVSSTTSSTSVLVVPVSDDWNEVCVSVCNDVCCSMSFFCSFCSHRAVFSAFLTVLQFVNDRTISSIRTLLRLFNSTGKPAYVFA